MNKQQTFEMMEESLHEMCELCLTRQNKSLVYEDAKNKSSSIIEYTFIAVHEEDFKDFLYEGDSLINAKKRALIKHHFKMISCGSGIWKCLRISVGNEYDDSKRNDFPFTKRLLSSEIYSSKRKLTRFLKELVEESIFEIPNQENWLED